MPLHRLAWLALGLACCLPSQSLAATATARVPVIIDTDMAIDDWLAMLYLLHHPQTEVLGVSVTGAGEAHCDPGLQHAVDLVDVTPQAGIPVACGPAEPLDGYNAFPAQWRAGADGFYEVELPASPRRGDPRAAPQLLIDLLEQAPRPVRLVVLGNATNVALALEQAPAIRQKIERIWFMGGAIWAPGNIIVPGFTDAYKNRSAEWNVLIDPIAARMLIESDVPLTLVPLDGTNGVRVGREDAAALKQSATSTGARFFSRVLDATGWFIDSGEYYFWDALTAALALHPQYCRTQTLPLEVVVAYSEQRHDDRPLPAFAAQRWDGRPRRNFDPYYTGQTLLSERGRPVEVCLEADAGTFKRDLFATINRVP